MALKKKPETKKANPSMPPGQELPNQVSSEIIVDYTLLPPATTKRKIHPRQVLPPLLEGEKVPDEKPTGSIEIDKN